MVMRNGQRLLSVLVVHETEMHLNQWHYFVWAGQVFPILTFPLEAVKP